MFDCTVTEMNGKLLDLTTSEYLILLQMRNRQLAGEPALTREELLERVTFEERTLDAALANLKRRGFITRRVELHLSEEGLSVAAI